MVVDSVTDQLERIVATFGLSGAVAVQLERPRNPDHGDLSTNIALILAKRVGEKPQTLRAHAGDDQDRQHRDDQRGHDTDGHAGAEQRAHQEPDRGEQRDVEEDFADAARAGGMRSGLPSPHR